MTRRNLTARFVDTVSTDKRCDFPDALVRGLQLRVTVRGVKTWALRYTRKSDGKLRRVTLGPYTKKFGLEAARTRALEELAAIAQGADPAARSLERKEAPTFAEVTVEWVERHGKPNKRERSLRDDQSMLDRHILPAIGSLKASEITKRDIIKLLDDVAAKSDARRTVKRDTEAPSLLSHRPNRVFALLRSIMRWAVGRDILKVDPTSGLKPPVRKERPRERELSEDEIRKLWVALDRIPVVKPVQRSEGDIPMSRGTALALMLALVTAQRIGEVTGIKIAELDLNDTASSWTVPGDRSKNDTPNRVPLSPLAVRIIREAKSLAGASKWLFPSPRGDGPIDYYAPAKALERARDVLGLEDVRVHDLRRTAATRMAECGVNPYTISLVLNHVSARRGTITGKVYNQYSYDREKREALERWGERLESIESARVLNVVNVLNVRG